MSGASQLLNRVKVSTSTTGTGTVNLGAASGFFQTFASAGAISGNIYSYLIEDGAAWELGYGIYTAGSPATMTRVMRQSSTGSILNLSGSATIACVPLNESYGAPLWLPPTALVSNPAGISAVPVGAFSGTILSALGAYYTDSFFWTTSSSAQMLTIDFVEGLPLTGIMPIQSAAQSQGLWDIKGSNDNVNFTTLATNQDWGTNQYSPMTFINAAIYRYYQLNKASGSTNSAPYQRWFHFRSASAGVTMIGTSTPTIRNSSITSSSNSSYTITWPSGTVAGDTVIIFAGHGFGVNTPSGWTSPTGAALTGSNFNGNLFYKNMTAADITAGSVTVTTTGGYNGVICCVTMTGTVNLRPPISAARNGSGSSTIGLTTSCIPQANDLILYFGSNRGVSTNTVNLGSSIQTVTATEGSGVLTAQSISSAGNTSPTFSYSTAGSGNYQAAVTLYK